MAHLGIRYDASPDVSPVGGSAVRASPLLDGPAQIVSMVQHRSSQWSSTDPLDGPAQILSMVQHRSSQWSSTDLLDNALSSTRMTSLIVTSLDLLIAVLRALPDIQLPHTLRLEPFSDL